MSTIVQKEAPIPKERRQFYFEKISTWIAALGLFFMFWQSLRDTHHDINDLRKDIFQLSERVIRLEVKIEEKK